MRIRPLALLLFVLSLALFSCGQYAHATCTAPPGYTNFTLANVTDAGGVPLPSGQIQIVGTDGNNNPINFHVGAPGGGVVTKRPVAGTVTDGAIVGCLYVADSALTIPASPSLLYHVLIRDTGSTSAHSMVVDAPGVPISGTDFVFDAYAFPSPPTLPAFAGGVLQGNLYVNGSIAATGNIAAPEICLNTVCATTWPSGGGGGGGSWGSIIGTLSSQTDLQTALNGKQSALGYTPEHSLTFNAPLSRSVNTISLDLSAYALSAALPQSKTCTGTDKVSAYDASTHQFTCSVDQLGTSGGGITSLNGSSQSSQSFVAGANIGISTNTGTGAHTFSVTGLAAVATSGSYTDLSNQPTIPAAQVNSDWNASTGLAQILNKPALGTAAGHAATDFDAAGAAAAAQSASQPAGTYMMGATSPLGVSGTNVTCPNATDSVPGCLTAADHATFNAKGPGTITGVTAGTGLNGGGATGTVTVNLNAALPSTETATTQTPLDSSATHVGTVGYTDAAVAVETSRATAAEAGKQAAGTYITGASSPLGVSGTNVTCPNATDSVPGCLTAADHAAFNAKAAANASTTVNGQSCALGSSCTVADSTKVPTTQTVNSHPLSGPVTVTASDVGLSSVTNDAQLKASQLSTDVTMGGGSPSDTLVASQKAAKAYADAHSASASNDAALGGGSPSATVPPTQSAVQAYVGGQGCNPGGANSPTAFCLTSAPYYASPAGSVTTTTSASLSNTATSVAVASCNSFSYGNGVLVGTPYSSGNYWIGTVSSCSGTTLTFTGAVSGLSGTLASGTNVQHDETAAFLAAFATLTQAGSFQGGTIWLPGYTTTAPPQYLVNGPLLDTGGANAVLPLPKQPNYVNNPAVISIKGFVTPYASPQIVTSLSTSGGNLIGGYDSATGGGFPNFTNGILNLENVWITDVGSTVSTLVNGTWLLGLQVKDVVVNTPATTSFTGNGIVYPTVSNNLYMATDNLNVAGFATCARIGEHTNIGALYAGNCTNAFVFDASPTGGTYAAMTNAISVNHLWCGAGITNCIASGSGPTVVNITAADFEGPGLSKWINDVGGHLTGIVNFNVPTLGGPGCTGSQYTGQSSYISAPNLQTVSLQCIRPSSQVGLGAYVPLTDAATITWAVSNVVGSNGASVTLGGNRTLAISGATSGMSGTLIVSQDGTGSRTLTLPSGSKVINGGSGTITLSTAANSVDALAWTYNGTNYFWTFGKNFN